MTTLENLQNRVTDMLEAVTIAFASADVTNVAVVVVANVGGVAVCIDRIVFGLVRHGLHKVKWCLKIRNPKQIQWMTYWAEGWPAPQELTFHPFNMTSCNYVLIGAYNGQYCEVFGALLDPL